MQPVTVGLVGVNGYGASYVNALLDDPRADAIKLVGVVDPAAGRAPRISELASRGCDVYPSLARLLDAADVDLVTIAAPTHFHSAMTCTALERGANVLCEKPLAGSLPDALAVVATQRKVGQRFAAIGYQWSFSQAIERLKLDIMSGALGRPVRMRALASYPRGTAYFTRNDWSGRIRTPAGQSVTDSPVNNATAHFLHNMFYLLGPTRETSEMPRAVQAELYRANDIENYDTAAMRCTTAQGVEVLFYTTHAEHRRLGPWCLLEFEDATVEYNAQNGAQFVARLKDGRVKVYGNPDLDRRQPLWQSLAAVRGGAPVACDAAAALAQAVCMSAAQEFPIFDLPASLRRTAGAAEGPMIAIDGLGDALAECYTRAILPGEHGGLSWAMATRARAILPPVVRPPPRPADVMRISKALQV
jgi:predicted dehydrogenase